MNPGGTPENLKPFKPGQSGNPKGRPKKLPEIDVLLAEVLGDEDGDEAKAILSALLKKAKAGDVRAAEVLLDRAYGKATQPIKGDFNGQFTVRWEEPSPGQNKGSA